MQSKQVEAIRISFEALTPSADELVTEFYDELFRLDPNTRNLFKSDMNTQKKKLLRTLQIVINGLDKLDSISGVVRNLGARHVGYQVEPAHFASVGLALIHAIEHTHREYTLAPLTVEQRDAWFDAFHLLAGVMQEGMRQVAEDRNSQA